MYWLKTCEADETTYIGIVDNVVLPFHIDDKLDHYASRLVVVGRVD
jgi:hypothetical protein